MKQMLALLLTAGVAISGCSHKDEGSGSSKSKKAVLTAEVI